MPLLIGIINEFPKSDFADDAMYNIGLCYYEMNQFQKCVETLEEMIEKIGQKFVQNWYTKLENNFSLPPKLSHAFSIFVQGSPRRGAERLVRSASDPLNLKRVIPS